MNLLDALTPRPVQVSGARPVKLLGGRRIGDAPEALAREAERKRRWAAENREKRNAARRKYK